LSDNGLNQIFADDYSLEDVKSIFADLRKGHKVSRTELRKLQSALLFEQSIMHAEKGWTQQFHLGALRNNNDRMHRTLGPDTGFDSIGDFPQAEALSRFFNRLDNQEKLAKTVVYNLNPSWNEVIATMMGNYNDGSIAGKMQFGTGWWFLDQKDGMERQMNALSNMGLISRFVGMLTDSRSFLSFPRHEYFRRILCNLFGTDIENGELPADFNWAGKIIEDICYHNARNFFELHQQSVKQI
jgi:glucuronate isomerase